MLFLLAHGEAEVAQLSSESEVFTVGESHKTALLQVEFALAVDVFFVCIDTDYLSKEHGVRAEELFFDHATFKAQRTFFDKRSRNFFRRNGMEAAYSELVGILSALDTTEVCFAAHCGGREVYDELAGPFYDIVGIAFGTNGNVSHRRSCTYDACPADSEHIGFFHSAAGNKGSRDRCEKCTAFPELFSHFFSFLFFRNIRCNTIFFCQAIKLFVYKLFGVA